MSRLSRSVHVRAGAVALVLLLISGSVADAQRLPAAPGGSVQAAETSSPAADEAQLRRLIGTLEDPVKREELLTNLRALLAAQAAPPPAPEATSEDPFASAPEVIAEPAELVGRLAAKVVATLQRVPLFGRWLAGEWRDPDRRALWIQVAVSCLVVIGSGILVALLIYGALRPFRHRLTASAGEGRGARATRVLLRLLLDLLPLLGFAVTAYVALELVQPGRIGRLVVQSLIDAVVAAEAALALMKRVFSPSTPELRLLPISDPDAREGTRWSGRIIRTAIYGRAALTATVYFGLPRPIGDLWLNVLFLAVAGMVALVIARIRRPVAVAIESLGGEGRSPLLRWLPWPVFARMWHVLALAYLAFVCLVWALGVPGGVRTLILNTVATAAVAFAVALALNLLRERAQTAARAASGPASADTPLLEQRMARYRSVLAASAPGAVVLVALLALLECGDWTWSAG
jgi:moderate conductance mechanosensitive channel